MPEIGRGCAHILLLEVICFLLNPGTWQFSLGELHKGSLLNDSFDGRHDLAGVTLYATKRIFLDYRRDVLPTLIHECLHALHPDWSERRVARWEKRIVKVLTPGEATALHGLLARRLPR